MPLTSRDTGPSAPDDDRPIVALLTDARCRNAAFVGVEVAALARAVELPVPPTAVVVGTVDAWLDAAGSGPIVPPTLQQLGGPVTIRAWLLDAKGTERSIGPLWFNIGQAAVEDSAIELTGIAAQVRDADGPTRLVMSLQLFVAADVSIVAKVGWPQEPVELRSCWGLWEDLGVGIWADVLMLSQPDLAVAEHHVLHKPTSTTAAAGGTRIVSVTAELRGKPALPVERAVPIAQACRRIVERLGGPAEFHIAVEGDRSYLQACRPAHTRERDRRWRGPDRHLGP